MIGCTIVFLVSLLSMSTWAVLGYAISVAYREHRNDPTK